MQNTRYLIILITSLFLCLSENIASAIMSDTETGQWCLIGQFKPQSTFRTEDTPPNNPIPIETGDMISQRNLFLIEWKHNLGQPLGIQTEYLLRARAFYDGAWDYGPNVMSDNGTRRLYCFENRDQIDDLEKTAELFLSYIDFTRGPVFIRSGRQVMSWGEMSTIRILDGINPLNTSSLAVDMSERQVPLWMARFNLSFDSVGPLESVSLGGYYVPGKLDNTYEEEIIDGSPVVPPIGRDLISDLDDPYSMASLKQAMYQKDSDIDKDRYGFKMGMLLNGLDLNLAYFRMFSEIPVAQVNIDSITPVTINMADIDMNNPMGSLMGGQKLEIILERDVVDVYGTSFNYHVGAIDTVVRGEAAYFKNVPKMSPAGIMDMIAAISPKVTIEGIEGGLNGLVESFPLGNLGNMPLSFTVGDIAAYDVTRYGIGLDKWINLSWFSRNDCLFTFEYVGSKILDYKKNAIMHPWYSPRDKNNDGLLYDTVWEEEYSNTLILIVRASYFNNNLIPQITTMYEVEPQALVLIPYIKYSWRKCDFELSYFVTESSSYEGTLGMLDKRDEITFSITVSF